MKILSVQELERIIIIDINNSVLSKSSIDLIKFLKG